MDSLKSSESLSPLDTSSDAPMLHPESPLETPKVVSADSSCSYSWGDTEEVDITEDLGASGLIELKPIELCGTEEQRDDPDPYQEIIELFTKLKARREFRAHLILGSASGPLSGSASPPQAHEGLASSVTGKEPMPDSCYGVSHAPNLSVRGSTSSNSSSEDPSSVHGETDEFDSLHDEQAS